MYVYLLHFERPIGDPANARGQAQHYIGCCDDVAARLETHRKGQGARITREVARRGIEMHLVRVWEGDRTFERRLKNRHNGPLLCPLCNETAHNRAPQGGVPIEQALEGVQVRANVAIGVGTES